MNISWLTAYDALNKIYSDGAYSNIALNDAISHRSDCDASFVRNIVKGTVRYTITIDNILDSLADRGIGGIKTRPLICLRMGIYAIRFMDGTPDHAAVSNAVDLAGIVCNGNKGFVNAILRSYIRSRNKDHVDHDEETIKGLSLSYSAPESLVYLITDQYGDEAGAILGSLNENPELCIRTNTLKVTRNELITELKSDGIECSKHPDTRSGVVIKNGSVTNRDGYKSGLYSIQSASSIRAVETLCPGPGDNVLDMCAAPGGKSSAMAEMMDNKGKIVSCDIHDHRLDLIVRNAERLGINIIETRNVDGTAYDASMKECFDIVLADVPCSGIGVIGSKPDIKLRFDDMDLNALQDMQYAILMNAYEYTRPGGRLMYSTCTINKRENEEIVDRLSKHRNVSVVEKRLTLPYNKKAGFYYCLMIKHAL